MGVPAAHIDKTQAVVGLHQPPDPAGRKLEPLGGDRVAIGGHHLRRDRAIDLVADREALGHRLAQILAAIHLLDQLGLAVVHPGLAHGAQPDVGYGLAAPEGERQLVGEADRPGPRQLAEQPAHEPGTVVARALQRLAELDGVLGLEVAAGQVVRAGEGHEGDLLLRPQGIDRVLQGRVQAPIGVQGQGGVRVGRIGLGDLQAGPGAVVELAPHRDHHIGRVIGAAQEHHQQLGVGGRRRPDPAGGDQGQDGPGGGDEMSAVHGGRSSALHEFGGGQEQGVPVLG